MSYETSFQDATDTCMEHLCRKLGSVENRDAFRYYLPLASPVWGFQIGGGGDVRNTWTDGQPTELRMHAEVRGRFDNLAAAQTFVMKLVKALPIVNVGNVKWLRLRDGGMPQVGWDTFALKNEGERETILWTVEAGLEIVFATTG